VSQNTDLDAHLAINLLSISRYFEDLFARDAGSPTMVNVASKAYRAVSLLILLARKFLQIRLQLSLKTAGAYTAKLQYYNGQQTVAHWNVRAPAKSRAAKNVILFIGDGKSVFVGLCEDELHWSRHDTANDHCCSVNIPQVDQWQIPIAHADGPNGGVGAVSIKDFCLLCFKNFLQPNDTFSGLLHH
jgi:hypothetical protein